MSDLKKCSKLTIILLIAKAGGIASYQILKEMSKEDLLKEYKEVTKQ